MDGLQLFLSKAGKEILIKSVTTATPTYVMSCFRIPKSVTKQITSVVSKFWWSKGGGNKGMHWKAWDKMCRSKEDGGLGFRVIDDFNTALLAKQLWRLMDAPESLFAKVFKGRYYRKSDPLDPKKANNPSYGWKSITSARHLVQNGLIKRVGDGTTISVWSDPWIPDSIPRPAKGPGHYYHPTLTVNQLMYSQPLMWNGPLLDQLFEPEDAKLIKEIPLSTTRRSDKNCWFFTPSGKYTVKTGYQQEYDNNSHKKEVKRLGPNIKPLQAFVWKTKCPGKLKHFMWQSLSGCIPVNANLRNRGIDCDNICTRCGMGEETVQHVLFECPHAVQTWALSKIPTPGNSFPFTSVYTNFDHLFWRLPDMDSCKIFPWILWYIWKARNDKVFNNIDKSPDKIVELAEKEMADWFSANCKTKDPSIEEDIMNHLGNQCFVDGSWLAADRKNGLGWYCTQKDKEDLLGGRNLGRSLTPLHAELNALLWALECMISLNLTSTTFYTDSTDIVQMMTRPEEWPNFQIPLDKAMALKEKFAVFEIKHIPRALNIKADGMARSVRRLDYDMSYVNSLLPVWFRTE